MAFSAEIKKMRFSFAGDRCECIETEHGHASRCGAPLVFKNNGREGYGAWEAHHLIPEDKGGLDNFSNCRAYCCECHEKVLAARH